VYLRFGVSGDDPLPMRRFGTESPYPVDPKNAVSVGDRHELRPPRRK
jgi:hypothetical protein